MIELPSIQQLENFIIYSKVKDIATAAREANVTRSAFSFQMKKLEEIAFRLCVRRNALLPMHPGPGLPRSAG